MTNELPNRYGSHGDETFGHGRGDEKSEMEESNDDFYPSERERRDRRESDDSNVRHRPRTRYPRRRLTSGSRNKSQGQEESRDLPLRQRMKIYRNRRPSR